jgi:hypothetical protein
MKLKVIFCFAISAAVSLVAATHRFQDSAHAIGVLKPGGGRVRHAAVLDRDRENWVLITTAAVAPPFSGNVRVGLEGKPELRATFHNAQPAVRVGLHHRPEFRNDTYYGLRPGDRIALWIKLARNGQSESYGQHCRGRRQETALAFFDAATDLRLLTVPIRFAGGGGVDHEH